MHIVNLASRRVLVSLAALAVCCPLPASAARRGDAAHKTGVVGTGTHIAKAGVPVLLAAKGKARFPIIVAESASERVRAAAATLAAYLGRLTGADFQVAPGDGATGIALGLPRDFPKLRVADPWTEPSTADLEHYILRTHAAGVYILGASELAVENAVWDFLYRLGHRQYFPGETWEIVPRAEKLTVALDVEEAPDYLSRRIWYGYGLWDYNREAYSDWCRKNRTVGSVALQTGHAYGGLIRALRTEFEAHPEYYALVNGKRNISPQAKLCIGNPELRRLIADYAVRQFDRKPERQSISMDPSDGGGWCECQACRALGSISDRALLLANQTARAVNAKYPGRFVGMYAYNFHSPPPNIRAAPNVVVSVATAFLKGGLTLDEIIEGWSRQGAMLGIREYYSVNTWDRDLPGQSRGANPDYLARTIPAFHRQGARFLSAESGDCWGPNGLGHYLAARFLWNVDEAGKIEALKEDFFRRAFGAAATPMKEFYAQLDGSKPHLVFRDQLARMFRALDNARSLANTTPVRKRLDHLLLYTRYVDLYHRYSIAKGGERQLAFERLIRHAYRMRKTMMVHTKALYRDLVRRDRTVRIPDDAAWQVPEERNPWKSSAPFAQEELAVFLREGLERYQPTNLSVRPVTYCRELVPATPLAPPKTEDAGELGPGRGKQTFYTLAATAGTELRLRITGGLIPHYRDRGNVRVELWKIGGASDTGERETLIRTDRGVPPDGEEHTVTLTLPEPGLYRIDVSDGKDRTRVTWPPGRPMVVRSTVDEPMNSHHGNWMMYFYVPKGTRTLAFHGGEHGEILDSAGRVLFWLNGRQPDFYTVAVPEGEDGAFWRVRYGRGAVRLLNVPPYFARRPEELLLPPEVVEADRR
ncbi:MAG: DUF4838 domain-containing protein [Kiritimatiellaeota bacterium]|nr:DUF4838 domain-containing protein [Kiritimatiellota bacterium]